MIDNWPVQRGFVHWPKGIRNGLKNAFVESYGHITDLMATCAEVAAAPYPRTFNGLPIQPMEGKSLLPHFTGGDNQRGKVFWEHEANIAMRDGKWKLVAKTKEDAAFNRRSLELYDVEADPSELNNLAARFPERVETMYNEWNTWAHKIGVYPMDTREYGARMRAYRRAVNGNFDDHLGGWNIRIAESSPARIVYISTPKKPAGHGQGITPT